jgi:hypothetical protein
MTSHLGFSRRNCSTWFEQRADRRKGLLDGLIGGQALAFAGMDQRAHRRQQVAAPVGPHAMGDLPTDCPHAHGLRAGVVGGWERSVFQEQAEMVLERGVAFLQALARRGLRLEGPAPRQPASEVPSRLRARGRGHPGTAFGPGQGPQEQRLHPRGTHRIPSLKGPWTIPQLLGSTDLPWRSRGLLGGTGEGGHPAARAMATQPLLDPPGAPAWTDHMEAHLVVLPPPCPLGAALDAGPRLSPAQPAATAQPGEDLHPPVGEAGCDRLAQIGQGPGTDGELAPLPTAPSQARGADGMRLPQGGRQTLDGGPQGRAGFPPHRSRGHRGLPTGGTITARRLYTCAHRLDRWDRARVIDGRQRLLGWLDPVSPRRATLRLGDDDVVRVRGQGPAPTGTSPTRRAMRPWAWAWRDVRLVGACRRDTRMVGVLDRLLLFGCEGCKAGSQALHLRPPRPNARFFFLFRALGEVGEALQAIPSRHRNPSCQEGCTKRGVEQLQSCSQLL